MAKIKFYGCHGILRLAVKVLLPLVLLGKDDDDVDDDNDDDAANGRAVCVNARASRRRAYPLVKINVTFVACCVLPTNAADFKVYERNEHSVVKLTLRRRGEG